MAVVPVTTFADIESADINTKIVRTEDGAYVEEPAAGAAVKLPEDDDAMELPIGTKVTVADDQELTLEVAVRLPDSTVIVNEVTTADEVVGDLVNFRDNLKTAQE